MSALVLENPISKILIVGPIYNKLDKLQRAKSLIPNYDVVIFNGNLCYPFDNLNEVTDRINILETIIQPKKIIYNLGNYDLKLLQQLQQTNQFPHIKKWLSTQNNVIMINSCHLIVTGGGVTPQMTRTSLLNNIETSFVSHINGKPWHTQYGGGYGYIVSNNPLTTQPPQFYNFSAQIGNLYGDKTQVYAQEADQYGLKRTILL